MGGKGGKGSHRTCEICGVKERHTSGELMFSQFPLEVNRCKSWLRAVGNEELVHLPIEKLHQLRSVCAIHFQRKDFNKKGNRLKKRAIPMLNLNAVPLSDTQLIGFPQYMWKNRNVGVLQGPSTSNQAQLSTNVGVLQGPSTSNNLNGEGFKYFNLRQVNQDALENLFGIIRQTSPTNRNPTCTHFMAALKTSVITKLSTYHSRGSNCEPDKKILLMDFYNLVFGNKGPEEPGEETDVDEAAMLTTESEDYPILSIPEEDVLVEEDLTNLASQPVVYVSGYLASRIKKKIECEKCMKNLTVENPDSDIYNYIQLREWWQDKQSLTYPSVPLCRLVETATAVTEAELCPRLHEPNICQLAVTLFSTKCDTKWFTCTQHSMAIFKMLFTRLALLYIRRQCQIVNRSLALEEERLADINKKAQQLGTAK